MIQTTVSSFAQENEFDISAAPPLKKSLDPQFTSQRNSQRGIIDITNQSLTKAHQHTLNERIAREKKSEAMRIRTQQLIS